MSSILPNHINLSTIICSRYAYNGNIMLDKIYFDMRILLPIFNIYQIPTTYRLVDVFNTRGIHIMTSWFIK